MVCFKFSYKYGRTYLVILEEKSKKGRLILSLTDIGLESRHEIK